MILFGAPEVLQEREDNMPEDIKKAIVVCVNAAEVPQLYEGAKWGRLAGLGRLIKGGTLAPDLLSPAGAAAFATLATGASPALHGVSKAGDSCQAEYLWEGWQRSSKQSVLFGYPADRLPDRELPQLSDPKALSNYLLVNPDWDLCFVQLGAEGLRVEGAEALDRAIGEITGVADEETLSVVVGLPQGGAGGFVVFKGSGVRQGAVLKRVIGLEDVAPTVCYLAEASVPTDCEGGVVYQALEDPDMKVKELRACRRNYERLRRSSGPKVMC